MWICGVTDVSVITEEENAGAFCEFQRYFHFSLTASGIGVSK
jgi:hypothetical protein